jgi:DNA-binding transcriptional MerR regulator
MGPHNEGEGPELPDRLFLRIGEVSRLTGVEPHVLRYWETEFRSLRPKKSRSGQRLYRRGDVELVLRVKDLLWTRKYTIAGAVAEIDRPKKAPPARPPVPTWEPPRATGDRPTVSHSVDLGEQGPPVVERPPVLVDESAAATNRGPVRVRVEGPDPEALDAAADLPEAEALPLPEPTAAADALRRLSAPAAPRPGQPAVATHVGLPAAVPATAASVPPAGSTPAAPSPDAPSVETVQALRALRAHLLAVRAKIAAARST